MTELILSLDGTPRGREIALWLALLAAFAHALMSALQKGRFDPWIMRGGIDICYALIALPLVLFVVPLPGPALWPLLFGSFLLHSAFKLAQASAFSRGAYTLVYPTSRGSGAVAALLLAWAFFGETLAGLQWVGLATLLAGIAGLALVALRRAATGSGTSPPAALPALSGSLSAALGFAVLTGALVALYTVFDAWALRRAGTDMMSFIVWFFLLDGLLMPWLSRHRLRALPRADFLPFALKSIAGGMIAWVSFGSLLIATRIGNLAETAVVRESSTVFAALIGWLLLGERSKPLQIAMMALIAAGAGIVKVFAG